MASNSEDRNNLVVDAKNSPVWFPTFSLKQHLSQREIERTIFWCQPELIGIVFKTKESRFIGCFPRFGPLGRKFV